MPGRSRFARTGMVLALVVVVLLVTVAPLVAQTQENAWLRTLDAALSFVEENYRRPVGRVELLRGAVKGVFQQLEDPHSEFLAADEYQEFVDSIQGELTGIGVHIEKRGDYITVVAPIKGTPAAAAGLLPGDRLIEADGNSLVEAPTERAARLIRGPAGTKVQLKVQRPAEGREFTVEITRAHIDVPIVEYERLPGGIGYVKLYSFSEDAGARVAHALNELKRDGLQGVVFDLRGNPGGFLHSAVDVAGIFLPAGSVVLQSIDRGGEPQGERASGAGIKLPLVVLIDRGSASASELVAGALQDHGRSVLVGERSFGKGTVQTLVQLTELGYARLTIAEYRTPDGHKVDGVGVKPDVEVPAQAVAGPRLAELTFERLLIRGHVGLDVLAIQQRLKDQGYYVGKEDGYYGGALVQAVSNFQAAAELRVNGSVDRETLQRLNEKTATFAETVRQQDPQKAKAVEILNDRLDAAPAA